MKKIKFLAILLFIFPFSSCSRVANFEVNETIWNDTFEKWDVNNASLTMVQEAFVKQEVVVKAENKMKAYYKLVANDELFLEEYVYAQGDKYYNSLMVSGAKKYQRTEISKEEFNEIFNNNPISNIFASDIVDYFHLKDNYASFTYDESKKTYNGIVKIPSDYLVDSFFDALITVRFADEKLSFLEIAYEDKDNRETLTFKDIGKTTIKIPTNYVDTK